MKSYFKRVLTAGLLLICLPASAVQGQLKSLDGQWVNLESYSENGNWVVFNVWAPRCPPCVDEAPELDSFHLDHHEQGITVVGLALDYPSFEYARVEDVRRFVDDYFLSFPILMLDAETAGEIFGEKLKAVPTTYIVNPDGEVVKKLVGGVDQEWLKELFQQLRKP